MHAESMGSSPLMLASCSGTRSPSCCGPSLAITHDARTRHASLCNLMYSSSEFHAPSTANGCSIYMRENSSVDAVDDGSRYIDNSLLPSSTFLLGCNDMSRSRYSMV